MKIFNACCILLVIFSFTFTVNAGIIDGLLKTAEVAQEGVQEGVQIFNKGIEKVVEFVDAVDSCHFTISEKCPNENITFWLYTRDHQQGVQLDLTNTEQLAHLNLDKYLPVIIIIHGYDNNHTSIPNDILRQSYFEKGDFFIISVDYGQIAKSPCYLSAVSNVPVIANCTAQMIDTLCQIGGVSLERFHVIGFSLGAQISGQLSNYLTVGRLPRITGLDPALPLFATKNSREKLDSNDAEFVDVIHTDALFRGTLLPNGHVDFYVNGGSSQPSCEDITRLNGKSSCDHSMAPKYYAESILSDHFLAKKCENWESFTDGKCQNEQVVIMGENVPYSARGSFFLTTSQRKPYALGSRGV